MSTDDLYGRWQEQIERITSETTFLFTTRYRFREVRKMLEAFQDNKDYNESAADIYNWLLGMWGRDAIMGVRRELDDQEGVVNLTKMLYEMEARPEVLTRRRYLAFVQPGDIAEMTRLMSEGFNEFGTNAGSADSNDDHLSPERIKADRMELQEKTAKVFAYAQRMVAHRTPVDRLDLKVFEINAAVDAIEPTLKKYYCVLTGNSFAQAEATIQYHWKKVFTVRWLT